MDTEQGPTVYHMELCSMLCGSLDGRGVWGRMDTCIHMKSVCCSSEIVTALFIASTPIQSKVKKKKKKKTWNLFLFPNSSKETTVNFLAY